MAVTLNDLLKNQPPVRRIPDARETIKAKLLASGKRMVIIDDDPTGPQAVQNVPVYFDWTVSTLKRALSAGEPVFFISTNSRSMTPEEMRTVTLEVGHNLKEAARAENADLLITSRSDSTLRGHFPAEIDTLMNGMEIQPDGIILVPAFFEGGRYTIDNVHYADQNGGMTPAHLTEFARDPAFPYTNSNLPQWVEEKTGGTIKAGDVIAISLETIRNGGPEAVATELKKAAGNTVIILNATCYEDLEIASLGIVMAEESGKNFFYRCSASFIKARGGFADVPLLDYAQLGPGEKPGLIIAGSYVEKTSRQVAALLDSGLAEGIEFHIANLATEPSARDEIDSVISQIESKLTDGKTPVVYTTRKRAAGTGDVFTATGQRIIQSLCRVVEAIKIKPGYVIAKGGITSIEIARTALKAKDAYAIGQILGGVPVLRLPKDTLWSGIPYVVFPGNVGSETALLQAVKILRNIP